MKTVLVLVACFAYVHCQDVQCIADALLENTNLQTCSQMLVGAGNNVDTFCGLSCIGDFRALYDTCGVTTNPITARKSLYIATACICMYVACQPLLYSCIQLASYSYISEKKGMHVAM